MNAQQIAIEKLLGELTKAAYAGELHGVAVAVKRKNQPDPWTNYVYIDDPHVAMVMLAGITLLQRTFIDGFAAEVKPLVPPDEA